MAELIPTSARSASGASTAIVSIDGRRAGEGNGYALEPGQHLIGLVGTARGPVGNGAGRGVGADATARDAAQAPASATRSAMLEACFQALPDRTYEVRTYLEGRSWHVEVIDQTTTFDVRSPCETGPGGRS